MGCDIHVGFETRVDGKWTPTFPIQAAHYWRDYIIEAKISEGVGKLLTGSNDYDVQYKYLEEQFEGMSLEEAAERFGSHPRFPWLFELPGEPTAYGVVAAAIDARSYSFFYAIAGVRYGHSEIVFNPRGVPDDCETGESSAG